ncbi:MAG TPA: hypothetical protein VF810_02455 [Patescibacteria group bacterium]
MKLSLAKVISIILNPMAVALFAPFLVIYRSTLDVNAAIYWSLYTLIFVFVMTVIVATGVRKKIFTDLDVSRREQRPIIFLIGILFTAVYILSLFFLHAPFILYVLAVGVILGVSIVGLINRRVKASVHVAAVTALILPVAFSFGHYYLLLLLLIPLIAWARLKTKRHTLTEILVGGAVGGLLSMSIYLTVKFFLNR